MSNPFRKRLYNESLRDTRYRRPVRHRYFERHYLKGPPTPCLPAHRTFEIPATTFCTDEPVGPTNEIEFSFTGFMHRGAPPVEN